MDQEEENINETGLTVIRPSQDLTISGRKVKTELPKYWTREYVQEKIELIENVRHKMLVRFLWMTGTRITEAVSLRKKDIDFNQYLMTIRWLKNRKYQTRVIPLHPTLRNILEVYTAKMKSEDLIFPFTRQRAWQVTERLLGGNPHRLRHSFAVNWLRSGGEITILRRMMGHARLESTLIYLQIVPVDQGKELLKVVF